MKIVLISSVVDLWEKGNFPVFLVGKMVKCSGQSAIPVFEELID